MKAHIAHVLQSIHGQNRPKQNELHLRTLQAHNSQLERSLNDKESQIDALKHQLANLEARVQEMMGTDALTGLSNRHVFKDHLSHSLKRALRLGYCLAVMLVDIDHLREINLKHGYEIGDKVLLEVAQVLKSSVREIDMPARWGGEELVTVLHETDAEGASVVAERVRRKVSSLEIQDPETGRFIKVTATVAVACYPSHSTNADGLLECAQEALLAAKEKGCNAVVVATR
jgi:diguanylate cyclase